MATNHQHEPGHHIYDKAEWVPDIVCGMDVDPTTTPFHTAFNDKEHYFCSQDCLNQFVDNPEKYLP
jgi:Cu+-exporting ATPase